MPPYSTPGSVPDITKIILAALLMLQSSYNEL